MTTMMDRDVLCPCCEHDFTVQLLTSTNTFGGKTTDLHTQAAGFPPLTIVIATCPACGYSNYGGRIAEVERIPDAIRQKVHSELQPQVQAIEGRIPASVSYAFGAHIAEWGGASHEELGDWWLKAAWAATYYEKDAANTEREYRLKAIHHFQEMVLQADEPNDVLVYLIGELYRRVGHTEQAEAWFNRVIEEADDPNLVELARDQRDNPRERI